MFYNVMIDESSLQLAAISVPSLEVCVSGEITRGDLLGEEA